MVFFGGGLKKWPRPECWKKVGLLFLYGLECQGQGHLDLIEWGSEVQECFQG